MQQFHRGYRQRGRSFDSDIFARLFHIDASRHFADEGVPLLAGAFKK